MGSRGAKGFQGALLSAWIWMLPSQVMSRVLWTQWAPTAVSVMPLVIYCSDSTMVNCPCQLGNDTHMVDKSHMEKYHYYYDKLTRCGYTVRLFGLPRFTAEK